MTPGRGAGRFSTENPRRGGEVLPREGGGGRGAGRVCAGIWGGGAKYFFPSRNAHQGYKTIYTPEKRDRIENPRHGQHPERDQNEIRSCILEARKGQDRVACQYTLGFSLLEAKCPETPKKRDTRLKNEIGRNLGK